MGEKRANAWGLHDLYGNAWEWCQDWWAYSYAEQTRSGAQSDGQPARARASGATVAASDAAATASSSEQLPAVDPSGPELGSSRVVRGGAWLYDAVSCRSACRYRWRSSVRLDDLGFRLSRTGPWHSYPITLVGAALPKAPEPPATKFAPYEVFRDPLGGVDRDGATAAGAAPEMVYLPGGTFQMGDGAGHSDEQPVHPVRVSAFALGRTPVTCGQYLCFCEATDSHWPAWLEKGSQYHLETGNSDYYAKRGITREALDLPVVGIGWEGARAYCDWLSEETGERYALPTEAQWEYACRAGSASRWCCGDDAAGLGDYAWFDGNAGGRLHPVGQKLANAWGLYDMHGNCWEWCADWYAPDYYRQLSDALATAVSSAEQQRASGWQRLARALGFGTSGAAADGNGNQATAGSAQQPASENPSGPESGSYRVVRGGAWCFDAADCRSAFRYNWLPSERSDALGFRLSRTV